MSAFQLCAFCQSSTDPLGNNADSLSSHRLVVAQACVAAIPGLLPNAHSVWTQHARCSSPNPIITETSSRAGVPPRPMLQTALQSQLSTLMTLARSAVSTTYQPPRPPQTQAFAAKSTPELLRQLLVLRLCQVGMMYTGKPSYIITPTSTTGATARAQRRRPAACL